MGHPSRSIWVLNTNTFVLRTAIQQSATGRATQAARLVRPELHQTIPGEKEAVRVTKRAIRLVLTNTFGMRSMIRRDRTITLPMSAAQIAKAGRVVC